MREELWTQFANEKLFVDDDGQCNSPGFNFQPKTIATTMQDINVARLGTIVGEMTASITSQLVKI